MKPSRLLLALCVTAFLAPVGALAEVIWVVGPSLPIAGGPPVRNQLVSIDSTSPGTPLRVLEITGLAATENVIGIDFRPATGGLVALTDANRLYDVDTITGLAAPIGSAALTPGLTGSQFGFDFNPTVDRIRVVSNSDQNLRLHPDLGTVVAADTPLAYAPGDGGFGINPSVTGVAYTNSVATATSTTLYGIDATRDTLVRIGSMNASPISPNSGQLFTIGALGVSINEFVAFDISSATGVAFASLVVEPPPSPALYTIDLSTGAATRIGGVFGLVAVNGLAVAQEPLIYTIPVVGSATGANGTSFRSDLILTNNSAFTATAKIEFYRSSATPNTGVTGTLLNVTLAPGQQVIYRDVLNSQFNVNPGTGSLRITASRPISVVANVYNDQRAAGRGTFGQLIRAYEESERRASGFLPALSNILPSTGTGARSNIGFFNPGQFDATVTLTAKSSTGATLATGTRIIPALAHQQIALSELIPALPSVDDLYLSYTATSSIFVYASVVDNVSGDGVYIPAVNPR